MNKLRKIIMATFMLCILLANITSVYAAVPSIQNINFPNHVTQTDSSGRLYVVPEGELYKTSYDVQVTIACNVYDTVSRPVVYYNGTQIGTMTAVTGTKNLYKLTWKPSLSQIGAQIGGPKDLKIVAMGANGAVTSTKKVYFTGGNRKYYDALIKDWTFVEPASTRYNCLSYVLGDKTTSR